MAFQTYSITGHKTPHLPSGMAVGSKAHVVLQSAGGPRAVGRHAIGPSQTQVPAEPLGAPRGWWRSGSCPGPRALSGGHDCQRPHVPLLPCGQDEPLSTPRRRRATLCHNQPRLQVLGQAVGAAGTRSGPAPGLQRPPRATTGRRGSAWESPTFLLTRGARGASPPAPLPLLWGTAGLGRCWGAG